MPLYLDTTGNASLAIAICARCSRKFPIGELQPDPNSRGLRVCQDDLDVFDPWRLPARQPEDISLRYPRPDDSLAQDPLGTITQDENDFLIAEDGSEYIVP